MINIKSKSASFQKIASRSALMRTNMALVVFVLVLIVPLDCFARIEGPPIKMPELPQQKPYEGLRSVFLNAESYIKKGQTEKAKPLLKQLKKYPLRPYLEYLELSESLNKKKAKDVQRFLKKYPDHYLARQLRNQWLFYLARQKEWSIFLKFYIPSSSTTLQCHYRNAQLSTGKTKAAYEGVKSLWIVGHSQPKACDPVFKAWINSSQFQQSYYWDRIALALNRRQFTLANYLAKQSNHKRYIARVKRWVTVYRNPARIAQRKYSINNAHDQSLIIMALKRLVRRNLNTFEQQWARYEASLNKSEKERAEFLHFIARWYSWHYYPQSHYWLDLADPELKDYELMQRRIRLALYQRNWSLVRDWILALPQDQRHESAWQYWLIRARFELLELRGQQLIHRPQPLPGPLSQDVFASDLLAVHRNVIEHLTKEHLGWWTLRSQNIHNFTIAELRKDLKKLAKQRSFYGFMASEILGQPLSLNHRTVNISQFDFNELMAKPGIQEAKEWYALERWPQAQRAWLDTKGTLSAKEKTLASKLAHDWGWYHQGIYTAAFSDHKDDLVIRFPLGFFDVVYEQTLNQNIFADWTFALIRQESAYRPNARSPVGALGLMQLMPSTARLVSKRAQERYPGNRAMLVPEENVKTGTRYLAQLYEQFNGNLLLATAAYNAGPRRSISWQHDSEGIPGDIWIETIPIQETRDYVKNIMTYQAIYRWHLGSAPRLSASVGRVPPLSETQAPAGIVAAKD